MASLPRSPRPAARLRSRHARRAVRHGRPRVSRPRWWSSPSRSCPGPSWARVAVATGGICGSDLHLFAHNTGPSPTLVTMGTFPFVLGHETAGRVVEAGPNCSVAVGTRVGDRPLHPLPAPRDRPTVRQLRPGMDLVVPQPGQPHREQLGRSLGFTQDLGGGWADSVLAHDSMLHPMPDAMSTAAPASTSRSRSPATACCAPGRSTANRS